MAPIILRRRGKPQPSLHHGRPGVACVAGVVGVVGVVGVLTSISPSANFQTKKKDNTPKMKPNNRN